MQIIDNAIKPSILRAAWADWPDASWKGWHPYRDKSALKYATRDAQSIPRSVWPALFAMANVVDPIANSVEAFPDWDLMGSGMHVLPPGGYLSRHLDANVMRRTGWRREFSCVLFANPTWQESWGGAFKLDGHDPIYPQFNRLVVFACTDEAWHEVEQVVGGVPRCSLSLFFWSQRATPGTRPTATFLP